MLHETVQNQNKAQLSPTLLGFQFNGTVTPLNHCFPFVKATITDNKLLLFLDKLDCDQGVCYLTINPNIEFLAGLF